MIEKAMQFTNDVLNQFLRNKFGLEERNVLINSLVEADGSIPKINQNKLIISLINIVQETNKQYYNTSRKIENGNYSNVHPTERYNLDILMAANFDDYKESLKFLNAGIQFFQSNPSLDAKKYSSFPTELNKLEFEIEKISYHQMHSLWTAMGAKYQPSVIYKMRLVSVQSEETTAFTSAVNQIENSAAV